ncbi:MAG: hypothetical protein JJE10_08070 [Thermoleophilia bacterium]|nr:hypothetical protein [Thermoleophilia bacterium]
MYVSIGGPIFLIAVGAILRYATNFDVSGIDMDTVGLILMIAGAVTLVLSFGMALANNNKAGPDGRPPSNRPPPPR